MPIQCEEYEYCKVKVQYVAEPELVNEKREEALQELQKQRVKVPGFRRGKATVRAIKQNCKKAIEEWVKKELVASAYDDVVYETKMKPIGYPQIFNSQLIDSSFLCDMIFLKKPEFELKDYKGFKIPKPHRETTATDDAEKMIQDLRVRHGDTIPYGEHDFVQEGDQVTMSFECKIDGEVFDPFSNKGELYTVGDNIIPDFDKNILGMTAGEKKEFDIIFVEGVAENLIDKRAKFNVELFMGTKNIPCPLDDSLAQKVGMKTYKELRQYAQGEATRQIKNQELQLINQQVLNTLLENHQFEVPSWLLLMEAQQFAAQQGEKWDDLQDAQKEQVNEICKKKVRLSMILDSIRETEPEASFSDDEIVKTIVARVEDAGQNPKAFLTKAQKDGTLIGIIASLKDEATIQWLVSKCEIIE
jgi:trigger factor